MSHLDVEFAHRLIRGKLAPDESAAAELHLQQCDDCRRIVAEERAWSNLLKLETREPVGAAASERMLPRLESLIPEQARRRRRLRAALALGCGACVLTAALAIAWRAATPTESERMAADLAISEDTQARILAHLPALRALRSDPWLLDEHATVEMFDSLLAAAREQNR
jgi:anti-sigma factor RsiW